MTPGRVGGWLPLDQYAAVGDGRSVALAGSIDRWCVPNPDSTPLFDRLLAGEDGARFILAPAAPFTVERSYCPGSNVLEQVFSTASGRARVTYSLNSGPSGRLPWSELGTASRAWTAASSSASKCVPGAVSARPIPGGKQARMATCCTWTALSRPSEPAVTWSV